MTTRHDWTHEEIESLYHQPLIELIYQGATIHRQYHNPRQMQLCHLISVKTGGCPEDCKYCAQSSRYQTSVSAQPLLPIEEVMQRARQAINRGASRICLGAAWRQPRQSKQFDAILSMVKEITAMGVEVCCTLGMLDQESVDKLKEAGLYSYNHNLDTSRDYYSQVTTTRTYDDRLNTLDLVETNNISVCCGGILGLGEKIEDRLSMLHTLATRKRHPDSVPINLLEAVPGTPFEQKPLVSSWELIRIVATARLLMPRAMVRLSCGRRFLSLSEQGLCYLAGANSIHMGDKLLTVGNPTPDTDEMMMQLFGFEKKPPFESTLKASI